MVLSKRLPRVRELSFQQILTTRICDFQLRSEGTLRECLIQLRHELSDKHIAFYPHFYFGA